MELIDKNTGEESLGRKSSYNKLVIKNNRHTYSFQCIIGISGLVGK